jgi:low temperature requirement protein LtrA
MKPRDPSEAGRSASPLELFFDLVFVVAVGTASAELHQSLARGSVGEGLVAYAVVFFGIWWAWMNFTWFATSFDTDDWLYRLLTFVQMAGVLVLAAGIEPAFTARDYRVLILSYVMMRVAMVAQWVRASRVAGPTRRSAVVYAVGITLVQLLWLLRLLLHGPAAGVGLVVLVGAELTVPIAAERFGSTPWHPHHITERYGLFTLILLGESLLASADAIIKALHSDGPLGPLITVSIGALGISAALWWIYFWPSHHESISTFRSSLRYGYVHYFVQAAAGALSAGIGIQVDVRTRGTGLSPVAAAATITIPVAIVVLGIWWIAMRDQADRTVNVTVPVGALLIVLATGIPRFVEEIALAVSVAIVIVLVLHPPAGEEV